MADPGFLRRVGESGQAQRGPYLLFGRILPKTVRNFTEISGRLCHSFISMQFLGNRPC